jgi:hypothetical protein
MKLLTAEILKSTPALYATEDVATEDKKVTAKFFFPSGRGTWFMTELDPYDEKLAFGYCVSPLGPDCDEWGYFSLTEMESLSVGGLGIERDMHFRPCRFSELGL